MKQRHFQIELVNSPCCYNSVDDMYEYNQRGAYRGISNNSGMYRTCAEVSRRGKAPYSMANELVSSFLKNV